ncbi:MAG: hypothetical protein Q9205_000645 [Flavoplaca limonia]
MDLKSITIFTILMKQHAVVLVMRAEPDDYPHLRDMGRRGMQDPFLSFEPLRLDGFYQTQTPSELFDPRPLNEKKYSTIACGSCRKLRIRCQGGAPPGNTNRTKPCNHYENLKKSCLWPEEDGRKRPRASALDVPDAAHQNTPASDETTSLNDGPISQSALHDVNILSIGSEKEARGQLDVCYCEGQKPAVDKGQAHDGPTTIHDYRELGPTAIAPGYKQISIKIQQQPPPPSATTKYPSQRAIHPSFHVQALPSIIENPEAASLPPLFDNLTSLPVEDALPELLDIFFPFYADNFCFLNRPFSRLPPQPCSSKFAKYFGTKQDGSLREGWELSIPFLDERKASSFHHSEFHPATSSVVWFCYHWLNLGTIASLLKKLNCTVKGPLEVPVSANLQPMSKRLEKDLPGIPREANANAVGLDMHEKSAQVLLFWCVYSMDRHKISVRLPENLDMTMLRAGPGGLIKSLKPEGEHSWQLHVPTFRVTGIELDMLVLYPFLLTWQVVVTIDFKVLAIQGISQNVVGNDAQPLGKKGHRPIKVDLESGVWILASKAKDDVLTRDLVFSLPIICQYDDLIAFLTQEEMENSSKGPVEDTVSDVGRLNLAKDHQERESTTRKGNEELYRGSIQAITDMLTFAKHIDDRALLTTFYLNQSYFHAACAYIRDMLQHNGELHLPEEAKGKTFPIPSRTAPSLVDPFQDYSQYPKNMLPATVSSAATASSRSYLTLIAKANYQCLREAIRDVAHYYSGAGWVDAVPDQREVVLRDVDLKIASDNIGASRAIVYYLFDNTYHSGTIESL